MDLKAFLFEEDRGVSPVIGVILMVAITVILAAVIATFVMNMGPPETTAPSASFSWNNNSSAIWADHGGGGAVDVSNLELKVVTDGGSNTTTFTSSEFSPGSGDLTAGDTLKMGLSDGPPVSAELIWNNPNSDKTQILSSWED